MSTTTTTSYAAALYQSVQAVRPGWESPTATLQLSAGDVVRVDVAFSASPTRPEGVSRRAGFYWAAYGLGDVEPVTVPSSAFVPDTGEHAWYSQSNSAIFRATDATSARFGFEVSEGDLAGHGSVFGLMIIATILESQAA